MEQFAPLLLLLFFWVFIGIPISLAKKAANQKKAARPPVHQKTGENSSPPAAHEPAAPERLTTLTSSLYEPDHDDSVFTGSLGAVTGEGYDPCHEEQMSGMEKVCKPGAEAPAAFTGETAGGLPLGWTGNDVVRGIVMSEILNRKRR